VPGPPLLKLAQDLEWLGCELEYYGHQHAMQGYPESGPVWEVFRAKQRGVVVTADKITRELKNAVRYNPSELVGIHYPVEEALDSVTALMQEVEVIKHCSVFEVQSIPSKVREFTRLVGRYLEATASEPRQL
jgi:hypothetical protein